MRHRGAWALNVATGIILNDFIGKATLRSNAIQHNVFWMAYAGVAALLCIVTKGQLGRRTDLGKFNSYTV
jgi:hypothetical protein